MYFKIKCTFLKHFIWLPNQKRIFELRNVRYKSTQGLVNIAAAYQPRNVEKDKYELIDNSNKSDDKNKPTFCMVLPPPNVTGYLHLGHALMATVQDVICRWKRQQGYHVVWIPGTDHAGIATQVVVEKKILKEKGLNRHELGKKALLDEIWKWKYEKGDRILNDLKKLGCSLNWEKEYFTMDKHQELAVTTAFIHLFEEGLINRKNALINWSCSLESAISDIEVENKEIKGATAILVPGYEKSVTFGKIYNISYKIDGQEKYIIVSTTRPETMLGDVAIAIHPEDDRYQEYTVKPTFAWHPFRNELIPIICDTSVDKEFGTGAVKITPAHDKNDFILAQHHNLEPIQVFTEKGNINENLQQFANMPRFDARNKILDALSNLNQLDSINEHNMILPICSRSKDIIEYMIRPQWFLRCEEMAALAKDSVRSGKINIHPQNFQNEWERWLNNCNDWCISRQLWWGHQIPAYLAKHGNKEIWVAASSEDDAIKKANILLGVDSKDIKLSRDEDVLDTWFSAALIPFAVSGWPDKCLSKNYYPLDVMETGHDILFFWVARMVMLGLKLTNDIPFKSILLNGIICDVHGRKMSKSLGNVILPEQVINGSTIESLENEIHKSYDQGVLNRSELDKSIKGLHKTFPNGIPECGTDALRFTLCSHNIKSHFINFDVTECNTNRLFFNKIWQATRFTLSAFEKLNLNSKDLCLNYLTLSDMDKWILSKLSNTITMCMKSIESYNFHQATSSLKNFFYSNLCDIYLETTKRSIAEKNQHAKAHCATLAICLSQGLQTMSPFTPYLSRELLQYFSQFIKFDVSQFLNEKLENEIDEILDVCEAIRQMKSQHKISKKHNPQLHIYPQSLVAEKTLSRYKNEILALTLCSNIILMETSNPIKSIDHTIFATAGHLCSFGISTNELFVNKSSGDDINKKKFGKLINELEKLQRTISNDGYKKSANKVVQEKHLQKIQQLKVEIENIRNLNTH